MSHTRQSESNVTDNTPALETPYGIFTGRAGDGCVQYLGIQYATLKDQLAAPTLVELSRDKKANIDATSFGPQAPSFGTPEVEQSMLIQKTIPTPPAPRTSGTECLNLNITVPEPMLVGPKIPVLVFVHGGGYIMGANWWPQYDPARLVKLFAEEGKPVVVVNINYRLHLLGNLTSNELRAAGYPGNNSLRDQRCAFQWVKRHIAAFGGNPTNVTAVVVSAGAAAILTHISSSVPSSFSASGTPSEPLFHRAIAMSGTPVMLKPIPASVAEDTYASVLQAFELENKSAEERIQALLELDAQTMGEKMPTGALLVPFVDGEMVTGYKTFEKLADAKEKSWCGALLSGHCEHDGTVFTFMGLSQRGPGLAAAFCSSFQSSLSASSAESILAAYDITPSTPDAEAMKKIIGFATDIAYRLPAHAWARSPLVTNRWHYQFNVRNPWDGPFKGCATHLLDAVFLFQNYNEHLSEQDVYHARVMAEYCLSFAYGTLTSDAYYWPKDKNLELVTTNVGQSLGEGERMDLGVPYTGSDRLKVLKGEGKVDLDEVSRAWDVFLAGR